jgi:lysozyme
MNYLIKKYEGCRLKAYKDAVGIETIGYGTTVYPDGTSVKAGDVITQDQADAYMNHYIMNHIMPHIKDLNLTDNQQMALISLIYNIGAPAFLKSKCYKAIKAKDWETVYKNWDWCKANGKFLKGLAKRRAEELYLFFQDL